MYNESIILIEMPDSDSISVCVYNENDQLFDLGKRINERFENAYMNGYNWDALISFYVKSVDPELMKDIQTDPEAGMFSAYINNCNPENLIKMKKFESHIRQMLSDESALMEFIQKHDDEIEWD